VKSTGEDSEGADLQFEAIYYARTRDNMCIYNVCPLHYLKNAPAIPSQFPISIAKAHQHKLRAYP